MTERHVPAFPGFRDVSESRRRVVDDLVAHR